ncbi:YesL family protein [Bifidobacterium sp.]|jgi:uncharacterized membrane protein YesL|uniref:YesL family protein n=1 Tax=Bifidobacterium sp. TaxID=41200 RepID=UPI0025BB4F86|nr:YesL family protein [Bifidobacterium sp.]MCI1634619.1 YesL family protein [Bifidobacterium sp.]
MQALSSNNRFNDFMSRIGDLAILNILWVICCLPVVTFGVATSALFETIRQIQEGHDTHIIHRFIIQLKYNFGRNLVFSLLYIAFLCLAFFDLHYLSSNTASTPLATVSYGCVVTISVLIIAACGFIFPLSGRSQLSVIGQLKQSLSVALRHPFIAANMFFIVAVPVVIAVAIPGGAAFVAFFWGLLFSAISAWLIILLMVHGSVIAEKQ